ncbi:hypothetical protein BO71DRAFT_439468 [Aspergillus ellipticus CBS 707.79]|uniref:Uncharacterized protein n=1 Tax=Aspergillus ellipticus CBS 707.79 TaxID=1448320 RepID=A0A319DGP8_9EURO|nr:hypothetical protein BO71DRAFT_439468 [Aspergillus ellipticus CBS 707.79]
MSFATPFLDACDKDSLFYHPPLSLQDLEIYHTCLTQLEKSGLPHQVLPDIKSDTTNLLTRDEDNILEDEEAFHTWTQLSTGLTYPLLMTQNHDCSNIHHKGEGMLSGSPDAHLSNAETRTGHLTRHMNASPNARATTKGPFLHFTLDPDRLSDIASSLGSRTGKAQTITVISPLVRAVVGLPVLNLEDELWYYEVELPGGKVAYRAYDEDFLCLWQITEPEIVGHWEWEDLKGIEGWYGKIVMPAFKKHCEIYFGDCEEGELEYKVAIIRELRRFQPALGFKYSSTCLLECLEKCWHGLFW